MAFPLKHYRGISVVINLELVSEYPPQTLAESGIDILEFKEKFCADGNCFIMRAKDEIEHIFSELYSVPDCLQKPYFKLKVQELLLFLCMVDVTKEKQREMYTSPQVEIVKEIHKKLISNFQTCRAACPPYVVPAFRHKQCMNPASLQFRLSLSRAILSMRISVHYRARRGEWRKTILSRKLICAVILFKHKQLRPRVRTLII